MSPEASSRVFFKSVLEGVLKRVSSVPLCLQALYLGLCVLSLAGCASATPLNALDHVPSKAWQSTENPVEDSERASVSLPAKKGARP